MWLTKTAARNMNPDLDFRGYSPQYAVSAVVHVPGNLLKNVRQGHYSNAGFPVLDDVYSEQVNAINQADRHYSVAVSGVVSCLVQLTKESDGTFTKAPNQHGLPLCPIGDIFEDESSQYFCWYQVQVYK
jgi:hypothetical protein